MSISAGHRAIASAFGWGHRSAQRAAFPVAGPPATSAPATSAPATSAPAPAVPAAVESGALVCSPWEGLYLEQAHPVTARGNTSTTGRQLDSFLDSLMYGE
ncbi:hypothetical protein ACFUTU_02750 [Arthrobacter sp. NPDC057388]|uniref:hypothetical protein n=1 Tax=Arthrobacter sp. NPDC057388 TaxID=3346116 RepID=UPI0036282310